MEGEVGILSTYVVPKYLREQIFAVIVVKFLPQKQV